MTMTKAEMAMHHEEYYSLVSKANRAEQEGFYAEAVKYGIASCDHIDGMMQYERKYEETEILGLQGLDIVLRCAPFILDFQSIDKLETFVKGQRRIKGAIANELETNLSKARSIMSEAHRLWGQLEQCLKSRHENLFAPASGNDQCLPVIETWQRIGLISVKREGDLHWLALTTQMNEPVFAKCSSCGVIAKSTKSKFTEPALCPKCRQTVFFVLVTVP